MSATLEEAKAVYSALPRADKARLLVWVAEDVAGVPDGIEFDPRVCGGSARIAGTRIPVWSLEAYRRDGLSYAQILAAHPTLKDSDLENAWAYATNHQAEVSREIRENEDEMD